MLFRSWAPSQRWQPANGGPSCRVPRLPAPPLVREFPSAVPRCQPLFCERPEDAHPAERPPAQTERLAIMSTSLAAALAALELGHLEPRAEDLSGMAPPPTEALEQTVPALWSDLFTTMRHTSIERDTQDDRQRVSTGKCVAVSVAPGVRLIIQKK